MFSQCHTGKGFRETDDRRGIWEFRVDLEECSGLDSTFMGTLAGLALRLRELNRGSLRILKVRPEHAKQFRDLGLDQLFFD